MKILLLLENYYDFSEITFKIGEGISEFYQKKMDASRALGLGTKLLLEGFIDGLPREFKQW